MKTIVSVQEIFEYDIKPPAALKQWRDMLEVEIKKQWADRSGWIKIDWPTCNSDDAIPAFEHYGIEYVESSSCGSVYARYRPCEEELWRWYRESKPACFWREQILPACEEARREKIIRPRADWVLDGIAEYVPYAERLIDVSSNGRGLLEILSDASPKLTSITAAGMTADLEGVSTTRIHVQPSKTAELQTIEKADVIVAIDALDRAADIGALISSFEKLLAPGGVIFVTASVASGFEVQTLWEESKTIIPPDKLNLPTVAGLQMLFSAPDWEILELSTPGMFDVEIVRKAIEANPDRPWPRAIRALVDRTDESGRMALVELLQSRRLASFARLVARRIN